MPIYEFRDGFGIIHEKWYASYKDAPDIGEVVELDGVSCIRIISTGVNGTPDIPDGFTRVLPRWWPHPEAEYNEKGHVRLKSRKQRDQFAKVRGLEGD